MKNHIRIFTNSVAVVTGAASGIGKAISEELARRGAQVVMLDLQADVVEAAAENLRSLGLRARAAAIDVTDFSALDDAVQSTYQEKGRLDYMFNNAGIAIGGDARLFEAADWNRIIDVNLRGVTNGVQAVYRIMIEQGFGHIVNTASLAGLIPTPGITAYAMTKHAVVGLSKSLRVEASFFGVRVSVLCPGVIRTAILEDGGKYGKLLTDTPPADTREGWERLRPMPPVEFAKKALDQVAANRPIILVPATIHVIWWIHRFSPRLGLLLAQKLYGNYRELFT